MPHAVAEKTETARRLPNAQALLKLAARLGHLGAWAVDLAQRRVSWSDEVCAIHEVPPGFRCALEEALGFYAPEDRPAIRAAFEACATHGRPYDLELRVITASGRRVWVRAIGEAERAPDGTIVGVHGAFQDVSRHKQAEEENRRLAERLTMTLESLTEAFFTLDRQWCFTYVNAEAESLLRRPREQLLGKTIWEGFPHAVGTAFQQQYERAMRDNTMVEFEACYPPIGLWVQVRAYPSPQGLAVSFRDITERHRAQEEILRLNAELELRVQARTAELKAANKELEAFAHSIAHDLRTPMAAINGFAEALADSDADRLSERGAHCLRRIVAAGHQLDEMTVSLLRLSCLARTAVHRRPVDLEAMARELVAGLAEREPQRNVEFVVGGDLRVGADPVLVRQVLSNLLGNAWKFTGPTAAARIEFGVQPGPAGERVFFVRDNGAGFDMAFAGRLFEPFGRLHSLSQFEGNGIGLATVHKIVARHEGRIWAEAAPDAGATFYFTLGP